MPTIPSCAKVSKELYSNTSLRYVQQETKTTKEELENAVRNYAQSDEVARGYSKGAAAWLNDERWTTTYKPAQHVQNLSGGQCGVKKTSYLGKISNASEIALRNVKARMEEDRNSPWGQQSSEEL